MGIIVVSSKAAWDNALKEAAAAKRACIVDWFAQWCGPCKVIAPTFETLSKENPGMDFLKVDVDENGEVAEEVGITSMPTFQVWVDGKKVDELIGASQEKLKALVAKYAGAPAEVPAA